MDLSHFFGAAGAPLQAFTTSLAVGLLIGLERERHPEAKAGLRTFALTALLGSVLSLLSQYSGASWLLPSGLLVVGVMTMTAYLSDHEENTDPGTTTIVAIVLCYALGAMIWYGFSHLAVPIAIVTTSLLYFKAELKGLTQKVTRADLVSILQFGVLSFIILPILPNRNFGPYEALNPQQIWWMVVLISGVSLAGYVALRIAGLRHGVALIGLFGGLVSSTATTLAFSRQAQNRPDMVSMAVIVILLASAVVLLRVAILMAAIAPSVLVNAWPALVLSFTLGAAAAGVHWFRFAPGKEATLPDVKNPTELRASITFGLLYAVVLILSAWVAERIGSLGVYGLALVSGLTDVDAITLSSLRLHSFNKLGVTQAVSAIGIALIANLVLKFALTLVVGGRALARGVAPGFALLVIGLGVGLFMLT